MRLGFVRDIWYVFWLIDWLIDKDRISVSAVSLMSLDRQQKVVQFTCTSMGPSSKHGSTSHRPAGSGLERARTQFQGPQNWRPVFWAPNSRNSCRNVPLGLVTAIFGVPVHVMHVTCLMQNCLSMHTVKIFYLLLGPWMSDRGPKTTPHSWAAKLHFDHCYQGDWEWNRIDYRWHQTSYHVLLCVCVFVVFYRHVLQAGLEVGW